LIETNMGFLRMTFRWPFLLIGLLLGLLAMAFLWLTWATNENWADVMYNAAPVILMFAVWLLAPYLLIGDWLRSMRRRRAGMVLAHVEEAVRLNLPLAPMMLAAAQSEKGIGRWRLLDLHDRLEQGFPLGAALRSAVPELPKSSARGITAADEMGCLPEELRRLVRRYLPDDRFSPHLDRFYRWYAIVMMTALLTLICGMIEIVVMPKFRSILASHNQPLPLTTDILNNVCIYLSNSPFLVIGAVVLVVFISLNPTLRDYLIRMIPVAGGAARDQAMADLCAFLTDALEAGQPLDAALRQAAKAQPNAILRRRVQRWADRVANGQSMYDAANSSRLPSLFTGMLKSAGGGEGVVQAMSFLARHYEYRFSRLREMMRAAAIPIFVVLMGGVALSVELAIFQPILTMIDTTATYTHHLRGF
jgi:type II secretory pathway component PulF